MDNNILSIQGYNLFRSDHTDDVKRGSVCTYNKKYQSIRRIDILHICESVVCEVTMQSNKGYIVVIYQSPCQSWAKFDNFLSKLGQLLDLIENLTHLWQSCYVILMQGLSHSGQMIWYHLKTQILNHQQQCMLFINQYWILITYYLTHLCAFTSFSLISLCLLVMLFFPNRFSCSDSIK